ncbi:hypothetical protein TrST_g13460 [Triparma strigata]|uniref:folate gamma-glutamyl hydrolase n=1 Tax=Triparma strigata TaxID=1606541 RepID=A0A9W7F4V9_9STRA|nr:hypothetical protein TrST_g13460 [Triparma strigata]
MTTLPLISLILSILSASTHAFDQVYEQPVIGILTFPYTSSSLLPLSSDQSVVSNILNPSSLKFASSRFGEAPDGAVSYFDASYKQWLEEGGARVAPIPYDIDEDELTELFSKINGVLFTGGPATPETIPEYFKTASKIYGLVTESEDHVPLWGTCLGFETISSIVAEGGESVLGDFDAEQISLPLMFTGAASESRVFGPEMPQQIKDILWSQNVTTNWHTYGVGVDNFESLLSSELVATSTNFDRGGLEFVSSMEHISKPVFAVQWHPESNQYDTTDKAGDDTPNRSAEGVQAMNYLSGWFVEEARKNDHSFEDGDDFKAHILSSEGDGVVFDNWVYWFEHS